MPAIADFEILPRPKANPVTPKMPSLEGEPAAETSGGGLPWVTTVSERTKGGKLRWKTGKHSAGLTPVVDGC